MEPADEDYIVIPAGYSAEQNRNKDTRITRKILPIEWDGGFEQWNIVRIPTPEDGSCLFHAIANAFFVPYHEEKINGEKITRKELIATFRKELSEKLSSPISSEEGSPTHYDILANGNLRAFSGKVSDFSLANMKKVLDSTEYVGYGYMEFIGNAIGKDIYILEAARGDLYFSDDLPLTIIGNRPSIVLYYVNNHFELVGIPNKNGGIDTHLSPNHSFIKFLCKKSREKSIHSNK